jgi:uncharacterized protein (TIGR02246 family)
MKLTKGQRLVCLTLISSGLVLTYLIVKRSVVGARASDADADIEAIRKLHQRDMAASKSGDFETLRSLMTDDAVIMPPGGKSLTGRKEIDDNFSRMREAMSQTEVLEYVLDFKEVKILGNYAYEWGEIRGRMRAKGSDKVESSTFKVMRILQKQPDGSWKVHRSMWNSNPG